MYKETTKFLIVDDFSTMRKIISKVLKGLGYVNTAEANDGQIAFDLLLEHAKSGQPFDFIITDWNMPNMNGLELLKKCRGDATLKDLPIMFVTGEGEEAHVIEAMKHGATEYVVKPFSPEKLKEKIENCYKKMNGVASKTA